MDPITREQMVKEFGEPGVQNPKIVDLIRYDEDTAKVELVMIERRAWGESPKQFAEIEAKINSYMGYVLGGHLADHYPKYTGLRVRLRLDCAQEPHGEAIAFLEAARNAIEGRGFEFVVKVAAATP